MNEARATVAGSHNKMCFLRQGDVTWKSRFYLRGENVDMLITREVRESLLYSNQTLNRCRQVSLTEIKSN